MRLPRALLALVAAGAFAGPAAAAPVLRSVELRLSAKVPFGFSDIDVSTAAMVSVDPSAGSLAIPDRAFGGVSDSVIVPVSGQTVIERISVHDFDLLAGTLRPGGVTTQAPGEICPATTAPVTMTYACDRGGSLGGQLGLVGTLLVEIIPDIVVIPIPLAPTVGVGGATATPFTLDGAPWTMGQGRIDLDLSTYSNPGPIRVTATGTLDVDAGRFSLVSPSFIRALGLYIAPPYLEPWRLEIAFTDGLGIPQFIVDAYDRDGDQVANWSDNCPDDPNPGQEDADSDGKGDACEPECSDGLDNDGDGDVDGADSACLVASFDDEDPPCADGLDNDGDGLTDYPDDPGCANVAWPLEDPACDDGLDNDADTATDFPADDGCAAASALSEAPECSDGLDNDGDGATDHPADPGCENAAGPNEAPACNDGINNDGAQDALIDFDGGAAAGLPPGQQTAPDPQCEGHGWGPTEIQEKGCGLGGEAALALLGIAAARRRRR